MTDTPKPQDEQQTPQLRVIQSDGTSEEVDLELNKDEKTEKEKAEEFWAGRNHAMRRSARVAA